MHVICRFPDDSAARMTVDAARQLCVARGQRHGLRFYTVHWDGTQGGPNGGPYLSAWLEPRQLAPVPALGTALRIKTIRSTADLAPQVQREIAADALRIGPEATGRKWQLSKWSVQQVMKRQGCTPTGKWRSAVFHNKARASA